jgi:hypothetical protein
METNSDADEPTPPTPPEPAPEPAAVSDPEATVDAPAGEMLPPGDTAPEAADELGQLAAAAAKARLAPVDEERLLTILKESLLGGRAGVARAVEVLPLLPWIVGVRGVEQTWPDLTAGFRTQLLAGLAKDESDGGRRMRLSLARALFKIDVPVAMKMALGALKDLRDKETGGLSPTNAQIVSNVFIGRGKPWLAQLPLADLKPAEIELLVQSAVLAAFSSSHPPVTQLGVIKWAQEAGRLAQLQEPALAAVLAAVGRWSAKWQNALRKEVPELPEAILAVLKPAAPERAPTPDAEDPETPHAEPPTDRASDEDDDDAEDEDREEDEERPRKERPVYEPRPQKPPQAADPRDAEQREKERPVYTPRNAGGSGGGGRGFNLNEALKGIEAHVQALRTELAAAQTKARAKGEDRRERREKSTGPIIEGEPTPEELARLNLQLEARNGELQTRITELMQHSEDLAASRGAITGEPVTDTAAQLRTLLGLKLNEDFADFLALEQESDDLVVQQHYPTILRHVFEVLREVQIPLEVKTEENA